MDRYIIHMYVCRIGGQIDRQLYMIDFNVVHDLEQRKGFIDRYIITDG